MKVGVPRETFPGEQRVAIVPAVLPALAKAGMSVVLESGAGEAAGFPDAAYVEKGAEIASSRQQVFQADLVLQVRALGANLEKGREDLALMRPKQIIIGMCDPLGAPQAVQDIAETGASLFALELIPRITRAQAMDVLSSMATIAGYRAVLLGAASLPKMCPMLTYAAGMLPPARVFVIGIGVAGLRAIATAKALGATVQAHDIRPTSREEAQSVGAKFVELKIEGGDTQDAGGYAKQMGEEFYQKQRELIADVSAECDLVITTAAIPGRKSPLLVTADAVAGMQPGSVIVDLAAERGGNCALSQPDTTVNEHGVTILGPTNLPSEVPTAASTMLANNIHKLLGIMVKGSELKLDLGDEIIRDTLAAHEGQVTNNRLRGLLGLEELPAPAPEKPANGGPSSDAAAQSAPAPPSAGESK